MLVLELLVPGHSLESGQQPPGEGGASSPSAQNSSSQMMFEQKLLDFRDLVTAPGKLARGENRRVLGNIL